MSGAGRIKSAGHIISMRISALIAAFTVLFALHAQRASGQNAISGKVVSGQTGDPIEDVAVILGSKTLAKTDPGGRFTFSVGSESQVRLAFRRIGYIEKSITASPGDPPIEVTLEESLPSSEVINVNESLQDSEDMLGSFYINSGSNSIDELISNLSGMNVVRRGNFGGEPVIRGMNSDRMRITLNGMKIQAACTDKMDPVTSYAEIGNLKSISVTKGSSESDHCSNSCTGIDMSLKEAETKSKFTLSGNLDAGYLSVSEGQKYEGRLNLGSPRFGTSFNAAYRSGNDYTSGSGEKIEHSGFNKVNASNTSIYKFDNSHSLTLDLLYDYAWDIGYPALTMDVKNAEAIVTGLHYEGDDLSPLLDALQARVYFNKVTHVMDDSQRNNRIKMDMPGWTETFGGFVTSRLNILSDMYDLKLDASVSDARAEMTMYAPGSQPMYMETWPDVRKQEYTLTAANGRALSEALTLNLRISGGVVDSKVRSSFGMAELKIFYPDFSGTDNRFTGAGSADLRKQFGKFFNAGITYALSVRPLTVSEQFAFYIFNRIDSYDYVGNPYLKNETSNQIEFSLNFLNDRFNVTTSFFGYFFSNYIVGKVEPSYSPMSEFAEGVKVYGNIPSASILGFEQSAEAKAGNNLTFVNSIQFTYGTDNEGEFLPQMPPLSGTFSARYEKDEILVQGETVWAAAQRNVNEAYGEGTSPSFAVFNLRTSYRFFDVMTLDAGIENILDAEYYEHLDWQKIPRPGRNFYAALKYDF